MTHKYEKKLLGTKYFDPWMSEHKTAGCMSVTLMCDSDSKKAGQQWIFFFLPSAGRAAGDGGWSAGSGDICWPGEEPCLFGVSGREWERMLPCCSITLGLSLSLFDSNYVKN